MKSLKYQSHKMYILEIFVKQLNNQEISSVDMTMMDETTEFWSPVRGCVLVRKEGKYYREEVIRDQDWQLEHELVTF